MVCPCVRQVLRSSKADGVFMPSCYKHTGNLCMWPDATKVQNVTYAEALADWFVGGSRFSHQLLDDCVGDQPCNANCEC